MFLFFEFVLRATDKEAVTLVRGITRFGADMNRAMSEVYIIPGSNPNYEASRIL